MKALKITFRIFNAHVITCQDLAPLVPFYMDRPKQLIIVLDHWFCFPKILEIAVGFETKCFFAAANFTLQGSLGLPRITRPGRTNSAAVEIPSCSRKKGETKAKCEAGNKSD